MGVSVLRPRERLLRSKVISSRGGIIAPAGRGMRGNKFCVRVSTRAVQTRWTRC